MNLAPWGALAGLPVHAGEGGLINLTLVAGDPPAFVVQRVNPIFTPAVHDDIEAVTAWLAARGRVTPRLVRTDAGALYDVQEDGVWRVMTWVEGQTLHKVDSPAVAAAAGHLVADFHDAVADLSWEYRNVRPGAHDTPQHLARLGVALRAAGPEHAEAVATGEAILEAWAGWQGRLDLPPRNAHGDLKVSNLRFDAAGRGVCLLDLDTLSLLPIDVELGDAFRSWCNPVGEDSVDARFDLELFAAAAGAYLGRRSLPAEERECLVPGVERIALELASRFCRDVIEDSYFGWDARRFPSRAAHNLFRARGQLALARDVRQKRPTAERLLSG